MGNSSRKGKWHERLRDFEAQRRSKTKSKLESIPLYWQSYLHLLDESLWETRKAYRLALGLSKAQAKLAQTLARGEGTPDPTLESLERAHSLPQEKFQESSVVMEEHFAQPIHKLLTSFEATVAQLRSRGKVILQVLQQVEDDVNQAWDAYLNNEGDTWFAEHRYRQAVSKQGKGWEVGNFEFSELFSAVKQAECQRRINLREYMVRLLHTQQKVFVSVEGSITAALAEWTGVDSSRETLLRELDARLDKSIQAISAQSSDADDNGIHPGDRQSLGRFYDELFTSISPMESEYIRHSLVVDKWREGEAPELALAVITTDGHLHTFVLPPKSLQVGADPREAFDILALSMEPSDSVELATCQVAMGREDLVIDLEESGEGTLKIRVVNEKEQIFVISAVHGEKTKESTTWL